VSKHTHHQATYRRTDLVSPVAYAGTNFEGDFEDFEDLLENRHHFRRHIRHAVKHVTKPVKKVVKHTVVKPVKKVAKPVKKVVKHAVVKPVKKVVVKPVKQIAKPIKKVVKQTVVKPVKKIVKETVVKPVKKTVKLTKSSIKSTLTIAKAGTHLTKSAVKISICPQHAAKILKQTGKQLGRDYKQLKKDMKPLMKEVKSAIKTFNKIAPYIGPVLVLVPGVGQVYLVAQIASTVATAYKAYAIYKAAEAAYYGIKYKNLNAVAGGILSACGQLGVPGVDKAAQIYTQGSMVYGAVKNKDYKMLLNGVVSAVGGQEAIKNYAMEIVGNNELLMQGLDYYEQGREVYKNGKQIYKAAKTGDLTGALNGATALIDGYVPPGAVKQVTDVVKGSAAAQQLIKKKKFGAAISAITGTANSVFNTDFTAKLDKNANTLNDISRDIKSRKISSAYQKIGDVYGIKLPDSVVSEINNIKQVKDESMKIYNDLRNGKVGSAYMKFVDVFGVSLPGNTVQSIQKLVMKEREIDACVKKGEEAMKLAKSGKYGQAYNILKPYVSIGAKNEKLIQDLLTSKNDLAQIAKLAKSGKYGQAYKTLGDKFNIQLPDSIVSKVEQGLILKKQVEAACEETVEIQKLVKAGKINQAYQRFTNLTGLTIPKTYQEQFNEINKYANEMKTINGIVKSRNYNLAYQRFSQLTGIKLSKTLEEQIAAASVLYTKIVTINNLVEEKKYGTAFEEFTALTGIKLTGAEIQKLNQVKGYITAMQGIAKNIENKQYTQAVASIKNKFNIDLQYEKDAINIINGFYTNATNALNLIKSGKGAQAYQCISEITGLTIEADTQRKISEITNCLNRINTAKNYVASGNLDSLISMSGLPKGIVELAKSTKDNYAQISATVSQNKEIIRLVKSGMYSKVASMPIANDEEYNRPELLEIEEEFEEEELEEVANDPESFEEEYEEEEEEVLAVNEEADIDFDEKDIQEVLKEVETRCKSFMNDLTLAQKIINTKSGKDIGKQSTDFYLTMEKENEKSNNEKQMVHKAINQQISDLHEKGEKVNDDAPIITNMEQLLALMEQLQ
jgi:hypothetical protein